MTFILIFALLDAFKEDGKILKESFKKDAEAFGFGKKEEKKGEKKEEKPKEDKK